MTDTDIDTDRGGTPWAAPVPRQREGGRRAEEPSAAERAAGDQRAGDQRAGDQSDGAAALVALARGAATGVLRMGPAVDEDGAVEGIELRAGIVVGAGIAWVPTPAAMVRARGTVGAAAHRRGPPAVDPSTWSRLQRESALDAVTALLARGGDLRFDPTDRPDPLGLRGAAPPGPLWCLSVERVLAETERRRRLLAALDAELGPWTRLVRVPRIAAEGIRLRPAEWSFLVALREGATPVSVAHRMGAGIVESVVLGRRSCALGIARREGFSGIEENRRKPFRGFLSGLAP